MGHGAWTLRLVAPLLFLGACRFGFESRSGPLDAPASIGDSNGAGDGIVDGIVDALPALCPGTYSNSAGHLYRYDTNSQNWANAQSMCLADQVANSSRFTHLAVAGDAAEVGVIQNFTGSGNVWIGLSDRAVEGTFVWVTDEATAGYPPATGAPWAASEPTGGANEDCGYEGATGFFDGLCTASYHFVCECDASPDDPSHY